MEFTRSQMQEMQQIKRAIQMTAANLSPALAREVAMIYPAYQVGKAYAAGDYITDGHDRNGDPILYTVAQAHTSSAEWPPESTPALYVRVSLSDSGYPIWAQPSGAHDAYDAGDIVEHNGTLYQSKIDGNVWSPDAYPDGWELYEEV